MSETRRNKNRGPQINFEVPQELKNQFTGAVKGKGLNARDLLERFVIAYLAEDPAAVAIASGKDTTPPSTNGVESPPNGTGASAGLYKPGESPSMESPRPFTKKILALLNSVPTPLRPVVEECVTQIVKLATIQNTGVTTDEQSPADSNRHFRKLKKLQDNSGDAEDISEQSA